MFQFADRRCAMGTGRTGIRLVFAIWIGMTSISLVEEGRLFDVFLFSPIHPFMRKVL